MGLSEWSYRDSEVVMEFISDTRRKKTMLHAKGDDAFYEACKCGHIETAKWLWKVCPDQEQLAMLHAADDYAFDGFVIKVI